MQRTIMAICCVTRPYFTAISFTEKKQEYDKNAGSRIVNITGSVILKRYREIPF
jgi:hypothetical protein